MCSFTIFKMLVTQKQGKLMNSKFAYLTSQQQHLLALESPSVLWITKHEIPLQSMSIFLWVLENSHSVSKGTQLVVVLVSAWFMVEVIVVVPGEIFVGNTAYCWGQRFYVFDVSCLVSDIMSTRTFCRSAAWVWHCWCPCFHCRIV